MFAPPAVYERFGFARCPIANHDRNDSRGIALVDFFDAKRLCIPPAPNFFLLQEVSGIGWSWVEWEIDFIPSNDIPVRLITRLQGAALQEPEVSDVVRRMITSRHAKRWLSRPRQRRSLRGNRVEDHSCAVFSLAPYSKVPAETARSDCNRSLRLRRSQAPSRWLRRDTVAADAPAEMLLERSSQQWQATRTTHEIDSGERFMLRCAFP